MFNFLLEIRQKERDTVHYEWICQAQSLPLISTGLLGCIDKSHLGKQPAPLHLDSPQIHGSCGVCLACPYCFRNVFTPASSLPSSFLAHRASSAHQLLDQPPVLFSGWGRRRETWRSRLEIGRLDHRAQSTRNLQLGPREKRLWPMGLKPPFFTHS